MNDKYISVITNFGCHYTCPYCIVKNNNLNIPKTTIKGLDSLWLETVRNQCNWISLSGGGDPLWNYSEHKDWYDKFFEITEDLNIELHTSLPNVSGVPYNAFDRVVYHLHSLEQLYSIKRQNCAIIRVVFVLVYTLTTRILESFEYESKMETFGKIAKAMIERDSNINFENLMNVLDKEKKDKK